jgi:hypothetical protein
MKMKKVFTILLMIASSVSLVNAATSNIVGSTKYFKNNCNCVANTDDRAVMDMCIAGIKEGNKTIVDSDSICFSALASFGTSVVQAGKVVLLGGFLHLGWYFCDYVAKCMFTAILRHSPYLCQRLKYYPDDQAK